MELPRPPDWSTAKSRQAYLNELDHRFLELVGERDEIIAECNQLFESAGVRNIRGLKVEITDIPATLRAKTAQRGHPLCFQILHRPSHTGPSRRVLVEVADDQARWFFRIAEPWMRQLIEIERRKLFLTYRWKVLNEELRAFRTFHREIGQLEQAPACLQQETYLDLSMVTRHERTH